ncbi:MAG: hypothetical protein ABI867_12160 [Kofleriaceae bacterium]
MRWLVLVMLLGCGHAFRPVEAQHLDAHAVAVGRPAPATTLTTASGGKRALADVLRDHDKTIVVFYRGFY